MNNIKRYLLYSVFLFCFLKTILLAQLEEQQNVFIKDYAEKIYGKATIQFVIINDSTNLVLESFNIKYNKDSINQISVNSDTLNTTYYIDQHSDLLLHKKIKYYSSSNFKLNNFKHNNLFYLIDKDFLNSENDRKLEMLRHLVK
jgi:hypothetical protein